MSRLFGSTCLDKVPLRSSPEHRVHLVRAHHWKHRSILRFSGSDISKRTHCVSLLHLPSRRGRFPKFLFLCLISHTFHLVMEDFPHSDTGKRKRSPADSLVDVPIPFPSHYDSNQSPHGSFILPLEDNPASKRLRLPMKPPLKDSGLSSLPPGVTQTIFSYLDPPSLGRLSCVNRRFQALLDSRFPLPSDRTFRYSYKGHSFQTNTCPVRSQDAIWTISRRRHAPSMPKPMEGFSEREYFALAFGVACQFCAIRPSQAMRRSHTVWKPVSGESSVHTLWPFRIRSCMQCLVSRLKKVIF